MPDHDQLRVRAPQRHAINPGLALQRQHPLDCNALQPRNHLGHVPVAVHDGHRADLLDDRHHPPVVRFEELLEHSLREHRPVVVGHVLGEGNEVRCGDLADAAQQPDAVGGQVGVHAVHQLGVVVEGVEVPLNSEQAAGEPEEAVDDHPQHKALPPARRDLLLQRGEQRVVGRVEAGQQLFVPVLVIHDARAVVRRRREAGPQRVGAQVPDRIEAAVLLDLIAGHVRGQALGVPALQGLIPVGRPLDHGQPVHRLPAHGRAEPPGDGHLTAASRGGGLHAEAPARFMASAR